MRVLECPPHLLANVRELLQVLVPIFTQFVIHQPLCVLALPVPVVLVAAVPDHVGHDAEEGQLLVVARQALVFRVVQLPRAVVVEYVPEVVRVAVKEILLRDLIVEELALATAQQGVRVLFQRVPPRLKTPSTDVHDQLLVVRLPAVLCDWRGGQGMRRYGHPAYRRRSGKGQPSGDGCHVTVWRNCRSLVGGTRARIAIDPPPACSSSTNRVLLLIVSVILLSLWGCFCLL